MPDIFLPTLHTFAMGNLFTGSCGLLRFRIKPKVEMLNAKEVDFVKSMIFAEYWHGIFCYEKSTVEGSAEFPMTEEGRLSLKRWLEEQV